MKHKSSDASYNVLCSHSVWRFNCTLFIGLIHANHGLAITDYIAKELKNHNNEVSS